MKNWLFSSPQIMCSFNLVPTESGTHIVFSWLREHGNECYWINNLKAKPDLLESMINELALCDSEDICFKPSYWSNIDTFTQAEIKAAFHHEAGRGPMQKIPLAIKI